MSNNKEILDFKCNQIEANTIMFSIHYKDAMVVIDARDTNYYTEAAAILKAIQGPLALKRKEKPTDLVQ